MSTANDHKRSPWAYGLVELNAFLMILHIALYSIAINQIYHYLEYDFYDEKIVLMLVTDAHHDSSWGFSPDYLQVVKQPALSS